MADPPVTVCDQVPRRGVGALEVVIDHLGARQGAEDTVELDQRDVVAQRLQDRGRIVGLEGMGHQHAGHLVLAQGPERPDLGVFLFVGLADQHAVARRIQDGLRAADHLGKELAVDARHDDADDVGTAPAQVGGEHIALVTHLLGGLQDRPAGLLLDAGTAREGPGHRRRRHAESPGYVCDRYHPATNILFFLNLCKRLYFCDKSMNYCIFVTIETSNPYSVP